MNPRPYKKKLKKLRKLNKELSRKQKGSRNRDKAKTRLAKLYQRITNSRADTLHKLTTQLAKNQSHIVVEDLDVSGLLKDRKFSRNVSDVGFRLFRTMLEYKTKWYGSKLVVVNRYFPSTKICSGCGMKKEISIFERVYRCAHCGLVLDRDLNAAKNLVAISSIETLNACGEKVRLQESVILDAVSVNQESNTDIG